MTTTSRKLLLLLGLCFPLCACALDTDCASTAEYAASGADGERLKLIAESARGDVGAVRKLLADGADPNLSDPELMTPLAWAARCGKLETEKTLVSAGARVDLPVSYQRDMHYRFINSSALIWAVEGGDLDSICFLLAQGADAKRRESVIELQEDGTEKPIGKGRNALEVSRNNEIIRGLRYGCRAGSRPQTPAPKR